jgi:hypothetical protein
LYRHMFVYSLYLLLRFDSTFPHDIARRSSAFSILFKTPLFTNTPFSPTYTTRRIRFPSSTLGVPVAFLSNNSNSKRGSSRHVVTSNLIFKHISAELVWIWDRLLFSPTFKVGLDGRVGLFYTEYTSVRGERWPQGRIGYGSVLFFVAAAQDRCELRLLFWIQGKRRVGGSRGKTGSTMNGIE